MDLETPHVSRFYIQSNTITYSGKYDSKYYQVLLGVVLGRTRPFVLHTHITNTQLGDIVIGVVDRLTQKQEQTSMMSGNAVCYEGYEGKYSMAPTMGNGNFQDLNKHVLHWRKGQRWRWRWIWRWGWSASPSETESCPSTVTSSVSPADSSYPSSKWQRKETVFGGGLNDMHNNINLQYHTIPSYHIT